MTFVNKIHAEINKKLKKFHANNKIILTKFAICLEKNGFNRKYIDLITGIFNLLRLKSKFYYISGEKAGNTRGSVEFSSQYMLYAAKPQYYYENFSYSKVRKQSYSVLKLNDVKIFGSSNVVLLGSKEGMYEPHYHDVHNKWDYTDSIIAHNIDDSYLLRYRESNKTIGSGIMFSGNVSSNYYHFMYEFLTKFLFLNNLDLPQNIPIIVDDVVVKTPQYQELLKYFNKLDRDLIYLKGEYSYKVETLYYLPFINIIPTNYKNLDDIVFTDNLFSFESIKFLRDTLIPNMTSTKGKNKIFLSRKNTSSRRYNESDVVRIFEKYGFEVVYPETYSVAEQMSLFNNAEFIAGATGAAFTNILFCTPGCKVLCLNSFHTELSIFSTIAKYLGLDFQYLAAHEKTYKSQDLHESFVIDPGEVEAALVDFLAK